MWMVAGAVDSQPVTMLANLSNTMFNGGGTFDDDFCRDIESELSKASVTGRSEQRLRSQ